MGIHATILLLLTTVPLAAQEADSTELTTEQQAVLDCMKNYKRAILARDGDAAAGLVDWGTLDYYDRIRQYALYADSTEVDSLSFVDRMAVLQFRLNLSADTLQSLNPLGIFALTVKKEWVGDNILKVEFGRPQVAGDRAMLPLLVSGREGPFGLGFVREEGKWKVDLTSVMPMAEVAIMAMVKQSGMTEDELMRKALSIMSGKAFTDDLWQPLVTEN